MKPPRPAPITAAGVLLILSAAQCLALGVIGMAGLVPELDRHDGSDLKSGLFCASVASPIAVVWLFMAGIGLLTGGIRRVDGIVAVAACMSAVLVIGLLAVGADVLSAYLSGRLNPKWFVGHNVAFATAVTSIPILLFVAVHLIHRHAGQYAQWRQTRRGTRPNRHSAAP